MRPTLSLSHRLNFIAHGLKRARCFANDVLNIISPPAPKTKGEISEHLRMASREHYQHHEEGVPGRLLFLKKRGVQIDFSELEEGRKNTVREFYKNPHTKDIISDIVTNIIP